MATQPLPRPSAPTPTPDHLRRAAAATRAAPIPERDARRRLCHFLCSLAAEPGFDRNAALPLGRADLAAALGLSLVRVKRVLALLALGGIVEIGENLIEVRDWARLCAAGCYDPAALGLDPPAGQEGAGSPLFGADSSEMETRLITAAGDQAFFG